MSQELATSLRQQLRSKGKRAEGAQWASGPIYTMPRVPLRDRKVLVAETRKEGVPTMMPGTAVLGQRSH